MLISPIYILWMFSDLSVCNAEKSCLYSLNQDISSLTKLSDCFWGPTNLLIKECLELFSYDNSVHGNSHQSAATSIALVENVCKMYLHSSIRLQIFYRENFTFFPLYLVLCMTGLLRSRIPHSHPPVWITVSCRVTWNLTWPSKGQM